MRKMTYLSPTSLRLWYEDREKFYLEYLCEKRKKRPPQTGPMAVGSAFDAYVKSFLHEKLIGKDPKFEFNTIFEAQVESHNRDEALQAGKIVFDAYQQHGGLLDILLSLQKCVGKPRFETSIEGFVDCVTVQVGAVPFLGKPDIYFFTEEGARIIFDWKVTGYYAARNYSPKKGYINRLPKRAGVSGRDPHKDAFCMAHNGFWINSAHPLDTVETSWADQLSIYAWLLGQDVGSKFIVAIDEIVCGKNWMGQREICIAQHRALVTEAYQYDLFKRAHAAWYAIQSEHVFDEVSKEQSDDRCAMLNKRMDMEPDELFDSLCG